MIIKIINIIRGWYYDLFKKHNDLYDKRYNICKDCEHHKRITKNIYVCELCGCLTSKKTRVLEEKCLIGKWT